MTEKEKQEIVDYAANNITDWIIDGSDYGFGEYFSIKSEKVPVETITCLSVNNAVWDWVRDSDMTWELAATIVAWLKRAIPRSVLVSCCNER